MYVYHVVMLCTQRRNERNEGGEGLVGYALRCFCSLWFRAIEEPQVGGGPVYTRQTRSLLLWREMDLAKGWRSESNNNWIGQIRGTNDEATLKMSPVNDEKV